MEDKIITVEELRQRLSANEPIFILDVRPIEQRNEWRIAGSAHVNAYAQLNEGDDSALDMVEIPKQATVVTVCAAGRTSLLASRLLRRKGIEAFSLEGGMKAWNYSWNTAEVSLGTTKIIQVRRPAKGVLSYVAGSLAEAVVIDAALDPEVYVRIAEDNGWTIRYVMDSHVHADFVSRTRELARVTGARHLMIDEAKVDFEFAPVTAGGSIHFGDTQLTFLHTPGHTWESTTFQIEDKAVFTGDTLFTDGVGRPDLKAELPEVHQKARALYRSLAQIIALPPDTLVLPAHTSGTVAFDSNIIGDSIANIRMKIPALRLSESDFIEFAITKIPPTPPNYLTIAGINRRGSFDKQALANLEAGGNHCSIA